MKGTKKQLQKYFLNQARSIQDFDAVKNPDPESVHQLRVATRRARAALWVIKKGCPSSQPRKLAKRLGSLGKELGEIREVDVAIQDAKALDLNKKNLKKKRKKLHRKFAKSSEYIRDLARDLARMGQKLRGDLDWHADAVRAEIKEKIELAMRKNLADSRSLHEFRVEVKKIRYAMETLGCEVEELRRLQAVLGRAHDLEVLSEKFGSTDRLDRQYRDLCKRSRAMAKPALRKALQLLLEPLL